MKNAMLLASCCVAVLLNDIAQCIDKKSAKWKNSEKLVPISIDNTDEESDAIGEVNSSAEIEVKYDLKITLPEDALNIFIADPEIIDVQVIEPRFVRIMALKPGNTSLQIYGVSKKIIRDIKVEVINQISDIKTAIRRICEELDINVLSIGESIVLKGEVPSPEIAADIVDVASRWVDAAKIVNKLKIKTSTQVMLKVKIAEVSRKLNRSIGFNWKALASTGTDLKGFHYGFTAGGSMPKDGTSSKIDDFTKNILTPTNGVRWAFMDSGDKGGGAIIDALASESFASVLAKPTLIALSGKTATFKCGGEKGFLVKQPGGTSDSNTTEFKEWGTSIEFTPVVLSEDRINITVAPKVSTVEQEETGGTPSINSKEASTTVELASGQSLAIAGLLQRVKNSSSSEVPFLGDIPIIGSLFRGSTVGTTETELVIIVTPYIVKPSSKRLKTPIDMIPRLYSPIEVILNGESHDYKAARKGCKLKKAYSPGFSIR